MKKHLLILLLTIVYLTTTTEFKQFLKLPVLVKHYIEHNLSSEQVGVIDYILIHYSEELVNDGDSDRDMQLPFKDSSHTITKTLTTTTPIVSLQLKPVTETVTDEKITVLNKTGTLKGYFGKIWNLPKLLIS
ncbi:MAG: hypothetical protein GW823_07645 [Bacteroidetes bacterium]|nr:hypothetical protein [Bacteroidota bacterium]